MKLNATCIILKYYFILQCFGMEPLCAQPNDDMVKYLSNNKQAIILTSGNEIKLFDKEFYSNQLFLLGEFHGTQYSYDLAFRLLCDIKKKVNIRYFLAELDNCSAFFINEYIYSGEESILDSVFREYKGTFFYSVEYRQLFIKIRQLNLSLSDNEKVIVIGMDIQHQPVIGIRYIKQLIKNHGYKAGKINGLDSFIEYINKDPLPIFRELKNNCVELLKNINNKEEDYKTVFNNDFNHFKYTIRNIINQYDVYDNRKNFDKIRDSLMSDNFSKVITIYGIKDEKMFGFWGRDHVYQSASTDNNWLASRIRLGNKINGIVSFGIFYTGCDQMLPGRQLARMDSAIKTLYIVRKFINDDGPYIKTPGIDSFKRAVNREDSIVLFRLNQIGSPYLNCKDPIAGCKEGLSATDYIQYAVLIRSSPATVPITNK